jgi:hypothetical protein
MAQEGTRFLTVLGSATGMKYMPADAFSSVPMTISRSRSDRIFQLSARVQNRAMLSVCAARQTGPREPSPLRARDRASPQVATG